MLRSKIEPCKGCKAITTSQSHAFPIKFTTSGIFLLSQKQHLCLLLLLFPLPFLFILVLILVLIRKLNLTPLTRVIFIQQRAIKAYLVATAAAYGFQVVNALTLSSTRLAPLKKNIKNKGSPICDFRWCSHQGLRESGYLMTLPMEGFIHSTVFPNATCSTE